MEWNPQQYEKFIGPREAPFFDLLALIEKRSGMRVVDLGCGPGGITRKLVEALPQSTALAIDSSAEMLARASEIALPNVTWRQQTIEDWATNETSLYDLIFSNAALHWVGDHEALLPRILAKLAPEGQIAAQLPADDFHPMRVVFAEVAGWRHTMGTLDIAEYAEILFRAGLEGLVVLEKIHPHVLADSDAVLEWARGSALLPYLAKLPVAEHAAYLTEVRRRLRRHYPGSPVFFPFRRVAFYGRRGR